MRVILQSPVNFHQKRRAEPWCCICCQPVQAAEQTIKVLVIWNALMFLGHHHITWWCGADIDAGTEASYGVTGNPTLHNSVSAEPNCQYVYVLALFTINYLLPVTVPTNIKPAQHHCGGLYYVEKRELNFIFHASHLNIEIRYQHNNMEYNLKTQMREDFTYVMSSFIACLIIDGILEYRTGWNFITKCSVSQ